MEINKEITTYLAQVDTLLTNAIEREKQTRQQRRIDGNDSPGVIYVNIPWYGEQTSRKIIEKFATGEGVTGEGMHGTYQFPTNIRRPGSDYVFYLLCTDWGLNITTKPMLSLEDYVKNSTDPRFVLQLQE